MSSSYLERLKTLDGEKHLSHQLTKPTKAAFGGFVGESGNCVSPKVRDHGPSSDDQAEFEEPAAICEFDGELPRGHAELLAVASVVPLAPGEPPGSAMQRSSISLSIWTACAIRSEKRFSLSLSHPHKTWNSARMDYFGFPRAKEQPRKLKFARIISAGPPPGSGINLAAWRSWHEI